MEVLGAVAAAGQLIGTAIGILDSISQLRDFLRHAPDRYKGWLTELNALGDTIACIVDNSALHTCQVKCIIDSMDPKIATLKSLCSRYIPQSKPNFISRLNNAFSARTAETRILQSLESLEHDKTTLLITISTLKEVSSSENSRQPTPELEEPKENSQNTYQEKEGSSDSYCRVSSEVMGNHDKKSCHSSRASRGPPKSDAPKTPVVVNSSARNMPPQPSSGMTQEFKMSNSNIRSNSSMFANTTGSGTFSFDNNEVDSHKDIFGNHTPEIASNWISANYSNQGHSNPVASGQAQSRDGGQPR